MAGSPEAYGYHGTTIRIAQTILQAGFRMSTNRYDWLGDGVYFWQDAPSRAWEWAWTRWGAAAAVVGCVIPIVDGMDLLDISWEGRLLAAYQSFATVCQQQGIALPVQTQGAHRLDRAVINFAVQFAAGQRETIRVVRAAFPEGPPIYPGSYLYRRSHVQIAVRDPALLQRCWQEPPP